MADPDGSLHSDVRAMIKAVGESTAAIGNLALKLEHQSGILEANEARNEKRLDKIEREARDDRKTSAGSRKEMHEDIGSIKGRLGPLEGITSTISAISTKIVGTLITMFVVGGIEMFFAMKTLGS